MSKVLHFFDSITSSRVHAMSTPAHRMLFHTPKSPTSRIKNDEKDLNIFFGDVGERSSKTNFIHTPDDSVER